MKSAVHLVDDSQKQAFRQTLLAWYDSHARQLPWREDRDPYRIWLSEIMLQQTRVAAVIEHYQEFLRRFPTVEKLAAASEAGVLAAWSGLGYYRRARMLHAAAKIIVRERGGKFPSTSQKLRDLPGIGRYTASAIASIAFDEAVPVVDGNVERILQRIFGTSLTLEECWTTAAEMLESQRPGDFNQAMMELGATVCTPRAPACLTCPVIEFCATHGELPREERTSRQKKKEIHFALHRQNGSVFLVRRDHDASLMAGMWELPEISADRLNGTSERLFILRHSITVTDYTVQVWRTALATGNHGKWIPIKTLGKTALTGLARKILRKAELLPGRSASS